MNIAARDPSLQHSKILVFTTFVWQLQRLIGFSMTTVIFAITFAQLQLNKSIFEDKQHLPI
jgi:hypothetical protein